MCLILLAWHQHEHFPLLIAANRDENHDRPTAAARLWPEHPQLLAGRDLAAGGTWLGMNRNGRFAGITNFRDPGGVVGQRSRGELCTRYLQSRQPPRDYLLAVQEHRDQYSGFNLLLGDLDQAWYYSNQEDRITPLQPGFYGLSNGLLNSNWPKVSGAVSALQDTLAPHHLETTSLAADLLYLMADREVAADHLLPDTGMGLAAERLLAPRFITSESYGTRASTIIMAGRQLDFFERSFDPGANCIGQRHYRLGWTPSG